MATTVAPPLPFVLTRAFPRLKYATPVLIEFGGRSQMGTSEDIAIGGLGVRCDSPPPTGTTVGLLFSLPSGSSVKTEASVRYNLPGRFGVQFSGLSQEARQALEEHTRKALGQVRRGGRVAKRLHVTLRSLVSEHAAEELAETETLSRNGGRLVCHARFKIGEILRLYWPEKDQTAEVRVVFRQLCRTGALTDLGFEFLNPQDFWGDELQ